jgi:hypothetical protein
MIVNKCVDERIIFFLKGEKKEGKKKDFFSFGNFYFIFLEGKIKEKNKRKRFFSLGIYFLVGFLFVLFLLQNYGKKKG